MPFMMFYDVLQASFGVFIFSGFFVYSAVCQPGSFSASGQTSCIQCAASSVAPKNGSVCL